MIGQLKRGRNIDEISEHHDTSNIRSCLALETKNLTVNIIFEQKPKNIVFTCKKYCIYLYISKQ